MKTKSTLCLVFSLAAVSILALYFLRPSRAAQQPSPPPSTQQPNTTLKVQAREVLLPVVVEDKHGALVTNLTAKDFTLTEDGRPQVIKSFTSQSNLPFRLGLLVDTSHSVSSALDAERKAAGKFIDLMLPADAKAGVQGDEAFLIHFDREVELLEDFTNSRDKLHHELDGMGPTSRERNNRARNQWRRPRRKWRLWAARRRAIRLWHTALRRHLPCLGRTHAAQVGAQGAHRLL